MWVLREVRVTPTVVGVTACMAAGGVGVLQVCGFAVLGLVVRIGCGLRCVELAPAFSGRLLHGICLQDSE